jgi:DMSO/TMAO reductase YedYZ molybdopterin-dependent catalytic subunit
VPPGQIRTDRWPVVHAGSVPTELTAERWTLSVHGEVERPTTLTYRDLLALPQKEVECDIHRVTSWSRLGMHWKGVPFTAIADAVAPRPEVRFVVMECEQGFTTSLPYAALRDDDVLLAHTVEGTLRRPNMGVRCACSCRSDTFTSQQSGYGD